MSANSPYQSGLGRITEAAVITVVGRKSIARHGPILGEKAVTTYTQLGKPRNMAAILPYWSMQDAHHKEALRQAWLRTVTVPGSPLDVGAIVLGPAATQRLLKDVTRSPCHPSCNNCLVHIEVPIITGSMIQKFSMVALAGCDDCIRRTWATIKRAFVGYDPSAISLADPTNHQSVLLRTFAPWQTGDPTFVLHSLSRFNESDLLIHATTTTGIPSIDSRCRAGQVCVLVDAIEDYVACAV